MRPDFELFAAFLVDMGRAVDRKTFDAGGERNWAPHLRAGTLGGIDDLPRRIVENPVVEGLQPDADILILHGLVLRTRKSAYLIIFATTPAPTVRPPSR